MTGPQGLPTPTGDDYVDIFIIEDSVYTWCESAGAAGHKRRRPLLNHLSHYISGNKLPPRRAFFFCDTRRLKPVAQKYYSERLALFQRYNWP